MISFLSFCQKLSPAALHSNQRLSGKFAGKQTSYYKKRNPKPAQKGGDPGLAFHNQ